MKLWHLIVAVVIGGLLALLWRRNPIAQISKELAAIDEARRVKDEVAERGAVIAHREVEARHAQKIKEFDEQQIAKRDELRADPVALSKWLNRLSG